MREPNSEFERPVLSPRGGRLGGAWRAISPLLVIAALAAVGVWGYRTGWRWGGDSVDAPVAAVAGPRRVHAPPPVGWCEVHGVHVCPLCRPDLAALAKPPVVSGANRERVAKAMAARPRVENRRAARWHEYRMEFPTADVADRFGVDIAVAWQSPVTEAVTAPGEITFLPSRLSRPTARAAGTVAHVFHKIGDAVKAGDLLALVDSADAGKVKAEFLQSVAQVRFRKRASEHLNAATTALPAERREADAALREVEVRLLAAEQALAYLGLPVKSDDYRQLSGADAARKLRRIGLPAGLDAASANLIPLVAPIDGDVIAGDAIVGEIVDTAKPLFTISDARQMALTLHVPVSDVQAVFSGMKVLFRPDGSPDQVHGTVTSVGLSGDETTRTVAVRAELSNAAGRLRAFTLGVGRLVLREEPLALVVPASAVVAHDGCSLVFVRDRNYLKSSESKVFHVRTVRLGVRDGDNVEIIAGLLPGEVVAATGADLLLKELLKNEDR